MTADILQVLHQMLDAYNAHDADRAASFYAEDAVIEIEGVSPHVNGRQAIADMFRSRFAGEVPDIHGEVLEAVADGDRIFSWLRYSGTVQGGGVSAGFGDSAVALAVSRKLDNRCLDKMTIRDGKIACEYAVINIEATRRQLSGEQPSEPGQSTVERNKALVRRLIEEAYNGKKLEVIDEIVASDCVAHMPGFQRRGPEGLKEHFAMDRTGWPDARCSIEDVVGEGDRVVLRGVFSGTLTGATNLGPPTGKYSEAPTVVVSRIAEGQIAEQWWVWDNLTWMLQMGGPAMVNVVATRRTNAVGNDNGV